MADIERIAAAVKDFAQWSEYPQFWDGIYRRLTAGVALSRREIIALNSIAPDIAGVAQFHYNTITL